MALPTFETGARRKKNSPLRIRALDRFHCPHFRKRRSAKVRRPSLSCSKRLKQLRESLPLEGLTVSHLLARLGQTGVLLACIILALPSILPIPVPGMSMPQGALIAFLGVGVFAGRKPWLPRRLLEIRFAARLLEPVLEKGAGLFARFEKLSRPRLLPLVEGRFYKALNSLLIITAAVILMAPFPIPFSNVLPAYGILFLAFGILQRDGLMVLVGYLMFLLSLLYIGFVVKFGTSFFFNLFGG